MSDADERVEAALKSFNIQVMVVDGVEVTLQLDKYDYRVTHFNEEAWRRLKNTVELFKGGVMDEATVKDHIRAFRDLSEVGHIDFNIRALEPSPGDFKRYCRLFSWEGGRITTSRTPDERRNYLDRKVVHCLQLTMAARQPVSEKLAQQFRGLCARRKEKPPELEAVILEYERYNPYAKKLAEPPTVSVNYDKPPEAPAIPAETAFVPEPVDNTGFESRQPAHAELKFKPPKQLGFTKPTGEVMVTRPEMIVVARTDLPVHEDFKEFCEELYANK